MTRKPSDTVNASGSDWEPDEPTGSFTASTHGRSAANSRGGIILMAVIAMVTVLAATLGLGAGFGWFTAPPPGSAAAEAAVPPVDAGDDDIISTGPLTIPTQTPGVLGNAAESEEAAEAAVGTLIDAITEVSQRADGSTVGLENIATGFVAGEVESLALERSQQGYTQTGAAKIVSVTARSSDLTATPPAILLEACIDTSDIDVVDANGTSLRDRLYDPGAPTLHLYGAQFLDGLWKIATHEIRADSTCS